MYDYSDDIAFAVEMIAEFGAPVDFESVPPATIDPAAPFGAQAQTGGPSATGVYATFVELSSNNALGISQASVKLLKQSQKVCMIAADGNDYTQFTFMIAGGKRFKVDTVDCLAPSLEPLLWYIGVSAP